MKKYTIELTEEERDLLLEILSEARAKEYIVDEPKQEVQDTILDWLYKIEDIPTRERAIQLCDPASSEVTVSSLYEALSSAFEWELTPEGHGYWSSIANSYRNTTK